MQRNLHLGTAELEYRPMEETIVFYLVLYSIGGDRAVAEGLAPGLGVAIVPSVSSGPV